MEAQKAVTCFPSPPSPPLRTIPTHSFTSRAEPQAVSPCQLSPRPGNVCALVLFGAKGLIHYVKYKLALLFGVMIYNCVICVNVSYPCVARHGSFVFSWLSGTLGQRTRLRWRQSFPGKVVLAPRNSAAEETGGSACGRYISRLLRSRRTKETAYIKGRLSVWLPRGVSMRGRS